MTQTLAAMKRKLKSTSDLYGVVETMKTMAAVNVGLYEQAYHSLAAYHQCIELGLSALLKQHPSCFMTRTRQQKHIDALVIFGSDQGMVGQYNDRLRNAVLNEQSFQAVQLFAIGERVAAKLQDDFLLRKSYRVPDNVAGISALVGTLLLDLSLETFDNLTLLHNRPSSENSYEPVFSRLLPPTKELLQKLQKNGWPRRVLPDFDQPPEEAFFALYREFIFISLCRASAEALVSENISRLNAMQRAEKNIEELLGVLEQDYNQERQNSITAELFDVIFGYTTLADK